MTDEVDIPRTPAAVEKKIPSKGVQIASLVLGIISFGIAAVLLICTLAVPDLEEMTRQIIWWGGLLFLLGEIIITFAFSSKRYRPAKPILIAGFFGLAAAIMLLISSFLH